MLDAIAQRLRARRRRRWAPLWHMTTITVNGRTYYVREVLAATQNGLLVRTAEGQVVLLPYPGASQALQQPQAQQTHAQPPPTAQQALGSKPPTSI